MGRGNQAPQDWARAWVGMGTATAMVGKLPGHGQGTGQGRRPRGRVVGHGHGPGHHSRPCSCWPWEWPRERAFCSRIHMRVQRMLLNALHILVPRTEILYKHSRVDPPAPAQDAAPLLTFKRLATKHEEELQRRYQQSAAVRHVPVRSNGVFSYAVARLGLAPWCWRCCRSLAQLARCVAKFNMAVFLRAHQADARRCTASVTELLQNMHRGDVRARDARLRVAAVLNATVAV